MAPKAFGLLVALLSTLLLPSTSAFNPKTDQYKCQHTDALCITAFKWCASSQDSSKGCSYPQGTYPLYGNRDSGVNPALVFWETKYNLSWTNVDDSYPVMVQWFISSYNGPYTWSRNFTKQETQFKFTFKRLAEGLVSGTNMSTYEVLGRVATALNVFIVSQPEKPSKPTDTSGRFMVVHDEADRYIETQRWLAERRVAEKWRRGVGIGVGIGATAVTAMAIFAGFYLAKKSIGSGDYRLVGGISGQKDVQMDARESEDAHAGSENRQGGRTRGDGRALGQESQDVL